MKNIIFDMETGDPDDLITLLMLLANPSVNLKAVTCYQGSPLQIGLIQHIINNSGKNIPVAGWNSLEPSQISPYYSQIVGVWENKISTCTPVDLYLEHLTSDTILLTGAPLTNIGILLKEHPDFTISKLVAQGGYLGDVVEKNNQLEKFKSRLAIRTYNMSSDVNAFDIVNFSKNIQEIVYVTKDLCHGFTYDKLTHESINFPEDANSIILKKALGYYGDSNKKKAMHDPLAMLYMLYPDIGNQTPIRMSYKEDNGKFLFSSLKDYTGSNTFGLVDYNKEKAWDLFTQICSQTLTQKSILKM